MKIIIALLLLLQCLQLSGIIVRLEQLQTSVTVVSK